MKKTELLELLNKVDNDFEIDFRYNKLLREDEINPSYPLPYQQTSLGFETWDIGYSSKKLILFLKEDWLNSVFFIYTWNYSHYKL